MKTYTCLVGAADSTFSNDDIVQQIIDTSVNIDSLNPGYPSPLLRIDTGAAVSGLFLNVTLIPQNPPIIIPPSGGSFSYNIAVSNSDSIEHEVDVWCDIILPDGSHYGPVLGPVNTVIPGYESMDRDRTQRIPANAVPGEYSFMAYIGTHPNSICGKDNILFEKLGHVGSDGLAGWFNTGEAFGIESKGDACAAPTEFALFGAYPNPFNPTTTFSYALPEAAEVTLNVYDISGRLVTTLANGWRDAGSHEVTFDATNLASGTYIYRLEAKDFTASGKMVMVK